MVEHFILHLFQYAEAYTFLFSWIAIPLGFYAVHIMVRRNSVQITEKPKPIEVDTATTPQSHSPELPELREATPNKNVVNA